MKTSQIVLVSLLTVGLVFLGGLGVALLPSGNLPIGGTGQTWSFRQFFEEGLTGDLKEKGVITTLTTTSTAQILTAAQTCNSNVVQWDNDGASSTLTLASATQTVAFADCLEDDGDTTTFLFKSLTSTTSVITITAGAGIDLIGENAGDDLIDEDNDARITFTRTSSTTLDVEVSERTAID